MIQMLCEVFHNMRSLEIGVSDSAWRASCRTSYAAVRSRRPPGRWFMRPLVSKIRFTYEKSTDYVKPFFCFDIASEEKWHNLSRSCHK